MAHRTKINGTTYEVSGGKTKINGTAYDISKGKTRVGGSAYDINFKTTTTIDCSAASPSCPNLTFEFEEGMTWIEWAKTDKARSYFTTTTEAGSWLFGVQTANSIVSAFALWDKDGDAQLSYSDDTMTVTVHTGYDPTADILWTPVIYYQDGRYVGSSDQIIAGYTYVAK